MTDEAHDDRILEKAADITRKRSRQDISLSKANVADVRLLLSVLEATSARANAELTSALASSTAIFEYMQAYHARWATPEIRGARADVLYVLVTYKTKEPAPEWWTRLQTKQFMSYTLYNELANRPETTKSVPSDAMCNDMQRIGVTIELTAMFYHHVNCHSSTSNEGWIYGA